MPWCGDSSTENRAADAIIRDPMRSAAAFVFFLAYAIFATRPLAFHPASATLIGADPLSHLWTMNWLTAHAFEPARIFHGNVFHPAAHAVLLTDLSMGTAVLV